MPGDGRRSAAAACHGSQLCRGPANTHNRPFCVVWNQLSSKSRIQPEALSRLSRMDTNLEVSPSRSSVPRTQLTEGWLILPSRGTSKLTLLIFRKNLSCCPFIRSGHTVHQVWMKNLGLEEICPRDTDSSEQGQWLPQPPGHPQTSPVPKHQVGKQGEASINPFLRSSSIC